MTGIETAYRIADGTFAGNWAGLGFNPSPLDCGTSPAPAGEHGGIWTWSD
jgi:hypothetical protein